MLIININLSNFSCSIDKHVTSIYLSVLHTLKSMADARRELEQFETELSQTISILEKQEKLQIRSKAS